MRNRLATLGPLLLRLPMMVNSGGVVSYRRGIVHKVASRIRDELADMMDDLASETAQPTIRTVLTGWKCFAGTQTRFAWLFPAPSSA